MVLEPAETFARAGKVAGYTRRYASTYGPTSHAQTVPW